MAKKKSKKKMKWTFKTWLITFVLSVLAVIALKGFKLIPAKWFMMFIIIVAVINLLLLLLAVNVKKKWKTIISIVLNLLVAVSMAFVTIGLPYFQTKMNSMFVSSNTENYVVNVYALTSEYKSVHSDIFLDTNSSNNLMDYYNSMFLSQNGSDQDNTNYAIEQITNEFAGAPYLTEYPTVFEAVDALYNGEGDALILSETFADMLSEIEGYNDFKDNVTIVATYTRSVTVEKPVVPQEEKKSSTFSVYAAGSDTRSGILSLTDRFDVNMIVTVNPDTHQVLILSLPRDSYIPNAALGYGNDKLTHCGIYGIQNTLNSVNNWLDTSIEYYGIVNFMTFTKIVDAVGGIDINNDVAFTTYYSQIYFPSGWIHLNGTESLEFVRERYNLPDGDFGRNRHQAMAMQALIEKLTSPSVLPDATNLLNALGDSFLTNVDMNMIYSIIAQTLNDGTGWEIISYHILGGTGGAETASFPGQLLSCVFPYQNDVDFVKQQLDLINNGEVLTQQTLPSSY